LPWKAGATANILLLDTDELIGHSPENGRPGGQNENDWGLRSRMLQFSTVQGTPYVIVGGQEEYRVAYGTNRTGGRSGLLTPYHSDRES